MAAFAMSGCAQGAESTSQPPSAPSTTTIAAPATVAPLPDPAALTDVLAKLSDPAIPGADKLPLVEGSTVADAAVLDNFAKALQDNHMLPLTFAATDLTWSAQNQGNVQATVTATPPTPDGGAFTFPMNFTPTQGGWQLSSDTAGLLLAFGNGQSTDPATSQPPPAAPEPSPEPAPIPPEPPAPSPAPATPTP